MKDFGTIFFVLLFFPYILNLLLHGMNREKLQEQESRAKQNTQSIVVMLPMSIGYARMPLEEYLIGALAASIDTSYEEETLKAQAVILRSAMIQKGKQQVYYDDKEQSYWSKEEMEAHYGEEYQTQYCKLKQAVEATESIYIAYHGNAIAPPFCALSSGNTRNGKEALGALDYEYLQSVPCKDDILSEHYLDTRQYTGHNIEELLADQGIKEGMGQQIEILQSDSAGYVLQIRIGEQELKGEVVRQKLGLHSACFQIIKKEDGVLFKSKGLGHGLGMSQYTANVMAQNGSQFMDILTYFFHDITIEKYE